MKKTDDLTYSRIASELSKGGTEISLKSYANETLRQQDIEYLPDLIKQYKNITRISLTGTEIYDDDAKALAEALQGNTALTSLDLSDNQLSDKSAEAFGMILQNNHTLTTLTLRNNLFRGEGAKELARALNQNKVLTAFYLSDNQIGNKGAIALAKVLQSNTALTELDIRGNNIDDEGAKALANALHNNTILIEFNFDGNNLGSEGLKALQASVLSPSSNILRSDIPGIEEELERRRDHVEALAHEWGKYKSAKHEPLKSLPEEFKKYTSAIKRNLSSVDQYGIHPNELIESFSDYVNGLETKETPKTITKDTKTEVKPGEKGGNKEIKKSEDHNRVLRYMGTGTVIGAGIFGIALYALRATAYSPNGILPISLCGLSSVIAGAGAGYFLSTRGSWKEQGVGRGE